MILIKGGKIKPITGAEIENGELLIVLTTAKSPPSARPSMRPRMPRSSTPRAAS